MLNIKYFVDSAADITRDFAAENNIGVLGMPILFEDGAYLDWTELSGNAFYEKLAASKTIPTTAQVPVPTIDTAFRDALQSHDAIVYFALSSKGSGTYQAANLVKNDILTEFPGAKIEIVDSLAYSLYIVAMLMEAMELNRQGKSLEEIVAGAKKRREYSDTVVVVDTLKYLEKGGRINKASLIMGTLLDLKPVLSVRGGVMESIDKFRGSKTVIPKIIQKMKDLNIDESYKQFFIVHSNASERAQALWDAIRAEFGADSTLVMQSEIGATVGTHIGPGTLAVFFKTKTSQQLYDDTM